MRRTIALCTQALLGGLGFVAVGCASTTTTPAATVAAAPSTPSLSSTPSLPLHRDVASLEWLTGRWVSSDGSAEEWWTPLGDAMFGVTWEEKDGRTAMWEALLVRRDGTDLVFAAMPRGAAQTLFRRESSTATGITFTNPAHDFPKSIRYARDGEALAARVWDAHHGLDFAYRPAPRLTAPALEQADRRFADEVARRGVDGWAESFDPAGAMGRGGERIEGRAAMAAAMRDTLAPGAHLDWNPLVSGLARAGDLGFTAGIWRFSIDTPKGRVEKVRGGYVTVWVRAADGSWRALYDVGDPQAPDTAAAATP